MQVLASQLHFLANRNAGLAIPPLFWPVNCIKIGGHVVLLSGPTVYSLYCGNTIATAFQVLRSTHDIIAHFGEMVSSFSQSQLLILEMVTILNQSTANVHYVRLRAKFEHEDHNSSSVVAHRLFNTVSR